MPPKLIDDLRDLGLYYTAENLDDIVARAQKNRRSPLQLLETIVKNELSDRSQRSVERRLRRAKIGAFKAMTDFDWGWPKTIDRNAVERALHLDFLETEGNIVLAAAQGLGKTMIAKNIAYQAVLAGHATRFVTASELLLDLASQDSPRTLDRRIKYWSNIKLLVIDEIGYLSYDNRNADLLFQVVSRRYEKKSLVITTNLAFTDWAKIFPNAASTTALIDRIVHHSLIIHLEGKSYRLREATQDAKPVSRKPSSKNRSR
ncbi:MAG: IS21-like element helper ATPase IstB [Deltaproteobacteria bacterium]|nr:IS21-like element helper ATPase IstB [Deltaproteobacteria bacterium]